MKIGIDNRERSRIPLFEQYIKSGKTKFIDGVELGNYETSDINSLDSIVGIEYKKEDLLESIFSGLLDKQLNELKSNFQYPYLFIGYDGFKEMLLENLGINPEVIIGEFASILAREKITIMYVGDLLVPFACKVIERFYDNKTPVKLSNYSPIRNKPKRAKPTVDEIKRHIVGDIPRVGSTKGNFILNHYNNSIVSISNAPVEELSELKIGKRRIGEKLAKEIKEVLK